MYTNNLELGIIEGAEVTASNGVVKVKGKNGEDEFNFGPGVDVKIENGAVKISTKQKAMAGTVKGVISNMMKGVTEGFTKKMKILYAHFPITVQVKGSDIIIKDFLGEKSPRKAKVQGNTKVAVKGQEITITGPNKIDVGQTAANIKSATKIRGRDPRIFQDGIYVVGE